MVGRKVNLSRRADQLEVAPLLGVGFLRHPLQCAAQGCDGRVRARAVARKPRPLPMSFFA